MAIMSKRVRIFGLVPDDLVKTRQAAYLAAKLACFLLQSLVFRDLLNGGAQFVQRNRSPFTT